MSALILELSCPSARTWLQRAAAQGHVGLEGKQKGGELDLFSSTSVTKLCSGSLVIVIETRLCCSPHGLAQFQFLVLF